MDGLTNTPSSKLRLRTKTLLLIGLTGIGLILLLYALAQTIVLSGFRDLEQQTTRKEVDQILSGFQGEIATLNTTAADWAEWDDTYGFVHDGNAAYIESNTADASFATLRLNLMLFYNASGELVFGREFDLKADEQSQVSEGILSQFSQDAYLRGLLQNEEALQGIIMLPEGPMLVAARPILTSAREGPPAGTLIFGRYLNEFEIKRISEQTFMGLSVMPYDAPALPPDFQLAREAFSPGKSIFVKARDSRTVAGYALLDDIFGRNSLILRAEMPRDIYQRGQETVSLFVAALALSGLVYTLMMLLLLEKMVLARLARLSAKLRLIGKRGDLSARVTVSGQDELSSLSETINTMLAALQRSQLSVAESQTRLQRIISSIKDSIYTAELSPEGEITNHWILSPQFAILAGYPLEKFTGDWKFWQSLIVEEDQERVEGHFRRLLAGQDSEIEYRIRRESGTTIWVRDSARVNSAPDRGISLFGVISDITSRKEAEEALASERNLLRTLVDQLPDYIYVKDCDGRVLVSNSANAQQMGAGSVEETVGKTDFDYYPRPLATQYYEDDMAVIRSGEPLYNREEKAFHDAGEVHWVLTSKVPLRDAHGTIIGLVGVGRDITPRKLMEAALQESEERYRSLFENVPIGLYRSLPDGQLIAANPAMIQMFGYSDADQFFETPAHDMYVDPEDRRRWQATLDAQGVVMGYETEMRRADGSTLWVLDASRVIRDEDGKVICYEGSLEDVTESRRAAAALRESEDRFRRMAENILQGLMIYEDDQLVYMNDQAARILGYTKHEFAKMSLRDVAQPDDWARWELSMERAVEAGVRAVEQEIWIIRKDGMRRCVNNRFSSHKEGFDKGCFVVLTDITERKKSEAALRESEERFRTAFEYGAAGIALVGLDGHYLQVNRALCEMFGYSENELRNMSFRSNEHPEDAATSEATIRNLLDGIIQSSTFEKRYLHLLGETVWVLLSMSVVHDLQGRPLYFICQFQNITLRKQAEADSVQLLSQMEARVTELATVAEVSLRATTILDVDQLLWTVSHLTKENFGLYHAHIYLYDAENGSLNLAAGSGEPGHLMVEKGHRIPLHHNRSIVARAARRREGIIVNDVQHVVEFLPNPLLPETRSEMAIPMVVGDELIGVLDVQANKVNRFTLEDINVQTTLAAQVAIALHNARLFAENERRLAIIENSDEVIVLAALDTYPYRPIYFNAAGLRIRGFDSQEAACAGLLSDLYPPEHEDRFRNEILPVVMEHGFWRGELILLGKDGQDIPIEQTIFVIRDKNGKPRDLATIITDITARKQAEETIRRANRAYRTLSECNQAMVRAVDEVSLLQEVCQILVGTGGYRLAWVGRVEDRNVDTLWPMAHTGDDGGFLDIIKSSWAQLPQRLKGLNAGALSTLQPQVMQDLKGEYNFPAWTQEALNRGFQSAICVPLFYGDHVYGTLNIYADIINGFDDEEVGLLIELASDLAFGLIGLQTRIGLQLAEEAERQQRIMAEALRDTATVINSTLNFEEVLERLLDNVELVMPHDTANVMLIEQGRIRVVSSRGYVERGLETWIRSLNLPVAMASGMMRMVETGQAVVVPDTREVPNWAHSKQSEWVMSYVGTPVRDEGQVIGFLNVYSETPNFFNQGHADRLQVFADQAGTSLRNARLFAAEREQRTFAQALSDTAAVLNSTLNFDEVLDRILSNVGRVVPHDAANIMLIEDGVARVARGHGYVERGLEEWIRNLRFVANKVSAWRRMMETNLPFAIPDTLLDPDWVIVPEETWIRSTVKAPIILDGEIIGILHLDSETPGFFNDGHAQRLQTFANQAAIAIQNARLYDRIQHYAAELEVRVHERTAQLQEQSARFNAQRVQLQAILDAMGEGVVYTVGEQAVYANHAWVDLLGYELGETVAMTESIYQYITTPSTNYDHLMTAIRRTLERGKIWRGEMRLLRKDGSQFEAALTVTQVPGVGENQQTGIVTIFRDISQEKALQAQKDRFIANASHELRTPLANVKTRLYLIRKQPERLDMHLKVLERVTDVMAELIESLLDISRFERGIIPLYRHKVLLQELINEVVNVQQPEAERKNITLSVEMTDDPLPIDVDPQRIAQVITNLVVNAINYTSEGGRVTVEAGLSDGEAVMEVRDTGIGIAEELVTHVFEPFFRANEGAISGTGLGLTIAKEIITLHGGDISVTSEVGRGSTFTVRLEIAEST